MHKEELGSEVTYYTKLLIYKEYYLTYCSAGGRVFPAPYESGETQISQGKEYVGGQAFYYSELAQIF